MSTIFFDTVNNCIYVLMAYLFAGAFLNNKTKDNSKIAIFIILWMLCNNIAINLLAGKMEIKVIATLVTNCLFLMLFYKASIIHFVAVVLSFFGLGVGSELIVTLILEWIIGTNDMGTIQRTFYYFIGGSISQLIIFIVIIILRRITRKDNYGVLKTGEWVIITVLPFLTICIGLGIFYAFNREINEVQMTVLSAVVLGILVINLSQYFLVRNLAHKEASIRVTRIITERAKNTNKLYDQLAEERELQRARNHDTIKLLTTAVNMAHESGCKELYDFLSENLEITENSSDVFDCGNPVINALINTKYNEARHKDIPVNYSLDDLSKVNLSNADLISVISNMLDNAIEASEKCEKSARYIRFTTLTDDKTLFIGCENTYEGSVVMSDKGIQSNKREDGHGYGLLNIKETAHKNHGQCLIDYDKSTFKVAVTIPFRE